MKQSLKTMSVFASAMITGQLLLAQVTVNVQNTAHTVTKTSANVNQVNNAVSKTVNATTNVVQTTGNAVQKQRMQQQKVFSRFN